MREIAQRLYEQVMPSGDASSVAELFTDDFVNHAAPPGSPEGLEGARAQVEMLNAGFSDQNYEIHHVIEDGDLVAVHCTWSATHTGKFMGIPATRKSFNQRQVHILRIADGKVAEHWAVRDDLGMLRQMGIAPG